MNQTFRRTDPLTSRQPVKNKLTHQLMCLAAIAQHSPAGICAGELGQLLKMDGLWKRLSELESQNLIVKTGESVIFSGTGKWQVTWAVAPEIKEQQHQLELGGDLNAKAIYWH